MITKGTMVRVPNAWLLMLSAVALPVLAQITPYRAPVVQPVTAPTVRPVTAATAQSITAPVVQPIAAPSVSAYSARTVPVFRQPHATLDRSPAQTTAFHNDIYLTVTGCTHLRCEAVPGMVGVMDALEGVLPRYTGQPLTLRVANAHAPGTMLETRHVRAFTDGHFDTSITGYDKPSGNYMFALYADGKIDDQHQVASGTFTVTRAEKADPLAPVAMNVVGTWYGLKLGVQQTYGSLRLNADGTYDRDGQHGTYVVAGGHVHFTGPLAVWNNGDAVTTTGGELVFHWMENGLGVQMSFAQEARR